MRMLPGANGREHRVRQCLVETLYTQPFSLIVATTPPDAALGILAALHDAGLPTHRLELAITESALTDAFMADLRNVGAGSKAIICAVSQMAARFDMEIVSEGSETVEQERANLPQLRLVV